MGINDQYYHQQPRRRAGRSMVVILILLNVAAWLANGLITPPKKLPDGRLATMGAITETMSVTHNTLQRPWMWWKFLTSGFAHSPGFEHILFNMLGLWFLGRYVEQLYGRWEFLWIYLVMIVLGSVVWAITSAMFEPKREYFLLGASGAVSGVILLFILNFPKVTLILFPIPIPVKAWVVGVILVAYNIFGQVGQLGNTAFSVHLVGMAFAYLYFTFHWNLSRLFRKPSLAALEKEPGPRADRPRHTCTVCGITDLDDPNVRFRYCSKCEGGLCYCSEHIRDHEHVTSERAEEKA